MDDIIGIKFGPYTNMTNSFIAFANELLNCVGSSHVSCSTIHTPYNCMWCQ